MKSTVRTLPRAAGRFLCAAVLAGAAACGSVPPTANPVTDPTPTVAAPGPTTTTPAPPPTSSTSEPAPPPPDTPPTPDRPRPELPRGGRELFPRYRLVGYAGLTGAPALGRLGIGDLDERVRELEGRAKPYARNREVLPVVEIIATIVQPRPGRDGQYRTRIADDQIERYLKAARRGRALLLLNIQPGQSTFLDEAKAYEKYLREPDVGLALDPEWAMEPDQIPGRAYGRTSGAELDEVSRYLSGLTQDHDLPEKVMVYHQVAASVVRRESGLRDHPGVAVVKSVDGIGSAGAKEATYEVVNRTTPDFVHAGFKLFYVEDREEGALMTPKQVLALEPRPEYVMHE